MRLLIAGWGVSGSASGVSVAVLYWAWPAPPVPMLGICSLLFACGGGGKVGDRLRDVGKISWNQDAV